MSAAHDGRSPLAQDLAAARQAAARAAAQSDLLSDLSRALLAAEIDLAELLKIIAARVAELTGGGCVIRLVTDDGQALVPVAIDHADPDAVPALAEVVVEPRGGTQQGEEAVLLEGNARLFTATGDMERPQGGGLGWAPYLERFGNDALLIAPLRARGETLGELVVTRSGDTRPFDDDDRRMLEDVASRAALAIANARLFVRAQLAETELRHANEALERRVAERTAQLARSNAELERFATAASHDLRAPLRTIRSFMALLREELGEDLSPDGRQYMTFIVDSAAGLDDLVGGLLSWARIGLKGDEEPQDVDLDEVLGAVLRDLGESISAAGASVEAAPLGHVFGRRRRLRQLLQNLIENALRYRSPDRAPTVQVEGQVEGQRLRVYVRDNGVGIDAKHHDRIFRMFKRLRGSNGESTGLGLGLTVCDKIVGMHGDRIAVQSAPDAGATFHFTLPLLPD